MTTKTKIALAKIGKDKKTREILHYMATHKKGITSIDAFNRFYVTRLSSIIYNLRHTYNLEIVSNEERTDKGVRYVRYTLVG